MNALIGPVEEETELLFGSRTIFIPGRTIEIGYSVRKKTPFPLVEELMLRFLNVVESATLLEITGFMALPSKQLLTAVRPLLNRGLMTQFGDDFRLTEAAKLMFKRSGADTPSLTESESLVHVFNVDDECALPTKAESFSEHLKASNGNLKSLINDFHRPASGNFLTKARINFGKYFDHLPRNQDAQKRIQDEQLELHKIEYAKTKRPLTLQVNIYGFITQKGKFYNRVVPFDTDTIKSESRASIRDALIEAVKVDKENYTGFDDVCFLKKYFGTDFLNDEKILSVIETTNVLQWFNFIPKFYSNGNLNLKSGDQRAIGEICTPRNLEMIDAAFSRLLLEREISPENPLRIAWLRPRVESWGRSISFLDGVSAIRELTKSKALKKGSVVFHLWENRADQNEERKPSLRDYWPWFDDVRFFRSSALPSRMEMLLVGDGDGVAVSHAFTPPQSPFPCPIGVSFKNNDNVRRLVSQNIALGLRSLPRPKWK